MAGALEDEAPRLAELHRAIQDFRNEFREVAKTMVRRDVYDAHMQTMELKINNLESRINSVQREHEVDENERRSTKAMAFTIAIPGIISFIIAIIGWLKG